MKEGERHGLVRTTHNDAAGEAETTGHKGSSVTVDYDEMDFNHHDGTVMGDY